MSSIIAVKMPKWGLSMQEGTVVHWWKQAGDLVNEGDDLVDIETTKITNTAQAPMSGYLRRVVAQSQETLPVGALIAVIAEADVRDEELARFIEAFQSNFVPEAEDVQSPDILELIEVATDGRTLRVGRVTSETASGPPIVLLHGFSSDLNNWLFNLDALRARASVFAIDLPGHGGSSKDIGDGSLSDLARIVGGALDSLGVTQAHLVGHSLGGSIAAQLAADRPDLARTLTLLAPAGLPGARIAEDFLTGLIDAQRSRDLRPWLEMLVADPAMISRDMVDDVLRFKRLDGVEEALGILRDRMIAGGDFRALQQRLGQLPPALVISGRKDAIVGGFDEAALPGDWRVAWIDGAGHMPQMEKASEVNAIILDMIKN